MASSIVITKVQPVTLFGQVIPGLAAVKSGSHIEALINPKGGKRFSIASGKLDPKARAKVAAMLGHAA